MFIILYGEEKVTHQKRLQRERERERERERCPWVCNLLYNVFPIHRTAKAPTVCARPK